MAILSLPSLVSVEIGIRTSPSHYGISFIESQSSLASSSLVQTRKITLFSAAGNLKALHGSKQQDRRFMKDLQTRLLPFVVLQPSQFVNLRLIDSDFEKDEE